MANRKRTKGRNFVLKTFNLVQVAGKIRYMNDEQLKVARGVYDAALSAGHNPNPIHVHKETRKIVNY
jgi:hypothetical protein